MNASPRMSTITPTILACAVALALTAVSASAADNDLRIIPQVTAGTAGVEPGLAMEWRCYKWPSLILRPEVFVSEDGQIGAGGAVLYDISLGLELPKRQVVAVGNGT